jgi:eukaryotic-like serine/threonine-protein kinase
VADSFLYYVMPFVEGESLRDRLTREKQLPIGDAVRIATEVASALDYAHRRGIIHRDIKPENILLHDGQALVADFGIALAATSASSRMTETGMSLGTPHYMSPEQAMGERILDARTDVYALGAMTYEMLVGDPPFTGSTAQAIVAKVLTEKPVPPGRVRDTIPEGVEDAVLTALQKLPADRFATAAGFAIALRGGVGTGTRVRTAASRSTAPSGPWRTTTMVLGIATVGLAALASWALLRSPIDTGPTVYDVATPDSARISFISDNSRLDSYGAVSRSLGIAASGEFAVYVALGADSVSSLWYRSLRTDEARPIPGTAGARSPRISPDGLQVAYFGTNEVMVTSLAGGAPRAVAPMISGMVLNWLSPTEILALGWDGDRAFWINPGGGEPRERAIVRCPQGIWAPDLGELLCSFNNSATTINLESGATHLVRTVKSDGTAGGPISGSDFRLIDGRYLIFVSPEGVLSGARYDPGTHRAQRAVALVSGVRREALGQAQYDVAANGTLIYAPGIDAMTGRLVRRAPGTPAEPLPIGAAGFQRYDLSRDGRWLAAVVQGSSANDLRIYDLRTGQHTVWQRAEIIRHPLWSPDGQSVLFAARVGDEWFLLHGSPGSGAAPDALVRFPSGAPNIDAVGYPNDTTAILQEWTGSVVARINPQATVATMDTVLTGARFPSVSTGGRLIAYQATEAGRVVVTTFPDPGRRWQIASQGVEPIWLSPSAVLYRQSSSWYTVTVNPATGEPSGPPVLWATDPRFSDTSGWSNMLTHDGGIIYVQGPEQVSPSHFRVIPNWVARMKRAVDAATP